MAAPVRSATPPAPPVPPAPTFTRRERIAAMTGVLLALLLAALDQTIVSTAGPAIQRDLHVSPETYPWITTAYLVASTVMVPIYGKLSDLYGRKPILLVGVAIFLLGSLLCGLAPSVVPLVAFRAVQGLGAAALFTSTFAVIADLFPPAERGKYTGFIGGVMGIASVVGPLVGGIITDTLGWHWVFFVNLPIGAVALWFIAAKMPRLRMLPVGHRRPRIDLPGAVALVVGVVPLLVALSLGRSGPTSDGGGYPWGSWPILGLFGVALVGIVAFLLVERRAESPLIDLKIFHGRVIGLGTAAVFVLGASFLTAVVFLPLFLVNVVGVSATRAGLTMMPLTLGVVVGSIGAGQVVARLGHYRPIMLGALAVLVTGFAVMAFTLSAESTQTEITLKMILVGLGIGPTFPIYTLLVQGAARPQEVGVVTAALTFARSLGQVIGVALLGTIFAATLAGSMARHVGAELAGLPPGARAILGEVAPMGAAHAGGEEGAPVGVAFDAATARAKIRQGMAAGNNTLSGATGTHAVIPDGGARARAGVEVAGRAPAPVAMPTAADREAALAAVDRVERGIRQSFTDATGRLYRVGLGLAVAALLLSLGIPAVRLRSGTPAGAPPSLE